MHTLNSGSVVARTPGIATAEIHGEVMALNVDNGAYYGMNRVGSRVWSLMVEPARVTGICDTLLTEFEVERGACEQQVLVFLNELRSEGIVEVRE